MSTTTKLVVFIGMIITALLFSSLLGILILLILHGPEAMSAIADPAAYSDPALVIQLKIVQIVNQIFGLLLPATLFILLTDQKASRYFSAGKNYFTFTLVVTVMFMLISQPAIGWLGELNEKMKLPASLPGLEQWLKETELKNAKLTDAFLSTTSLSGLVVNIFMIAILPALAEETVFRGALQPVMIKLLRNKHAGIIFSAAVFAAIHLQFYGFLPRFALGLAFGYLFQWSSNLWLPIIAHFINNLLSVMAEFLFRRGLINTNAADLGNTGNIYLIIISLVLSAILLTWIYRRQKESV
jgi:hypothetical protein